MVLSQEHRPIHLPHNIRCMRKRLALSQEELGLKVGLNRGNIASYEKGTAEPKICNLLKFATIFNVSIWDLTKKNLSDEDTYQKALNTYREVSPEDANALKTFSQEITELREVMEGIYTCHCHKKKSLNLEDKNIQMLVGKLEHLYEVSSSLMKSHEKLLNFIKCKMKP